MDATQEQIPSGPTHSWRARAGSLYGSSIQVICESYQRLVPASACHAVESKNVARSMMTHGAMLWGAGALQQR
jgi:hypothetical protein